MGVLWGGRWRKDCSCRASWSGYSGRPWQRTIWHRHTNTWQTHQDYWRLCKYCSFRQVNDLSLHDILIDWRPLSPVKISRFDGIIYLNPVDKILDNERSSSPISQLNDVRRVWKRIPEGTMGPFPARVIYGTTMWDTVAANEYADMIMRRTSSWRQCR